jgi:hypothetical protein
MKRKKENYSTEKEANTKAKEKDTRMKMKKKRIIPTISFFARPRASTT